MSQPRHLLILAFLLPVLALAAQDAFLLKTGFSSFQDRKKEGVNAFNHLEWEHCFTPRLQLELSSDLSSSDRYLAPADQKFWHNGKLGARYSVSNFDLAASYRNTIYGSSKLLGLYPVWNNLQSQRKEMQHESSLAVQYSLPALSLQAQGRHKHLRFTPYELDLNTFELVEQDPAGVDDIYYGVGGRFDFLDYFSASMAANHKDGLFAKEGQYRLTDISASLAAQYPVSGQSHLEASLQITNRDGAAISDEKRNLLQTRIRLQQQFSNDLRGWLLYVNNSCLAADARNIYLVSNYLRAQLQYTSPYDASAGSFACLGAKYSPENKANAWFGEVEHKLVRGLYAGAGFNLQPERLNQYSGKLSYHFPGVNEVYLQYGFRDYQTGNRQTRYLSLGSNLYW